MSAPNDNTPSTRHCGHAQLCKRDCICLCVGCEDYEGSALRKAASCTEAPRVPEQEPCRVVECDHGQAFDVHRVGYGTLCHVGDEETAVLIADALNTRAQSAGEEERHALLMREAGTERALRDVTRERDELKRYYDDRGIRLDDTVRERDSLRALHREAWEACGTTTQDCSTTLADIIRGIRQASDSLRAELERATRILLPFPGSSLVQQAEVRMHERADLETKYATTRAALAKAEADALAREAERKEMHRRAQSAEGEAQKLRAIAPVWAEQEKGRSYDACAARFLRRAKAAEAKLAKARDALDGIDTFAWSAMSPDCKEAGEEVMLRINACRTALAALRDGSGS